MKRFLIVLLIGLMTGASVPAIAQEVLDGLAIPEHNPYRKPVPWSPLREADIMWSKRVWRQIDLREKLNHPLYYPMEPTNGRKSMFDVIKDGIESGEIQPFSDTRDDFKVPLTRAEALGKLQEVSVSQQENPDAPGTWVEISDTMRIETRDIRAYEIKEDWFIDRQRSVLDVRILGICPVYVTKDPTTGAERGLARLFWLYFPNCRPLFAQAEVYNRGNDIERRTLDDIFWKRMFASRIIKETNVYDREISAYQSGIDILLEAENIKAEIFDLEHDMWHY